MRRSAPAAVLVLACLFILVPVLAASAAPRVFVDGQTLSFSVAPRMENGTTLVPMRGVFEALGASVVWDGTAQTVTVVKGDTHIRLKVGSYTAYRNEDPIRLSVPAKVINGSTLVPLRFVSESLGADVHWDGTTQTITISTGLRAAVDPAPVFDTTDLIRREYSWVYCGRNRTCELELPKEVYRYYAGLERLPTNDLSVYVTDPYDDPFIAAVAAELAQAAGEGGYSPKQTVEFVVSFVQSFKYVTDDISKGEDQHPRYPMETLVDQEGDCEDTSILLAALLEQMGYGAILLLMDGDPGHMAVGVEGDDLPGVHYTHQGSRYYYVETTGTDWKIGEVPREFRNEAVQILPLVPRPIVFHEWRSTTINGHMVLKVTVYNHGTGTAPNTRVYAAFDAGSGMVYNQTWSDALDLEPRSRTTYILYLNTPSDVYTRLIVRIVSDGTLLDESTSQQFKS